MEAKLSTLDVVLHILGRLAQEVKSCLRKCILANDSVIRRYSSGKHLVSALTSNVERVGVELSISSVGSDQSTNDTNP